MQPTTQKKQDEEFRRLMEKEQHLLMKRCMRELGRYTGVFLAIVIPVLAIAMGWIKD